MKIVCVPYRPDTPQRIANWKRTSAQWPGWHLLQADSDGEDFGRSQAINRAVAQADDDWEVLVIADSDLLLRDVDQAAAALELARETKGYIVCYVTFYYLDEDKSILVRAGTVPTPRLAYYSLTEIWIGMFAIHRELWDAIGGFDESFTSWGGEDGRFLSKVNDLDAPKGRVPGHCYHLAHPKVASDWS